MPDTTAKLETNRSDLLKKLATTDDMRRGSITECYRRCGKPTCACAAPDHPGHGPYFAYTKKVNGKTKTKQLRPGPLLTKLQNETNNYREFKATCEQLINVNEIICDSRPVEPNDREKKRNSTRLSKQK